VSILLMAVSMMALFGTIIVLPFLLQGVFGLDPLATGLLLLPGGLVMGVLAPFVGRLYDRVGPRPLVIPGAITVSLVLWGLTMVDQNTSVWFVLGAHIALSAGLAFMFTPLFTAGLGSLTPRLYSHGSAIIGTVQQLAGAAGTALFVALMASVTAQRLTAGATQVAATASGIQAAFLCGAIISVLGVVAALFVRRPAEAVDAGERMPEDAPAAAPMH
jgi:DHA2 family lincomycin resistance protein-like MFS transporter